MMRTPLTGVLACALAVLGACRATDVPSTRDIAALVRDARYDRALDLARQAAEANPDDPEAQALVRDVRVHRLLHRARGLVFDGHGVEALDLLGQAREIDPQNPLVSSWITKIRVQLAEEWLNRASEFRSADRLEEARQAYEHALAFVPADAQDHAAVLEREAKLGLARVLLLQNYRAGLSKSRFDKGLRSFHDFLLHQARHDFEVSETYDPENERAVARSEQVDELLAQERLALARSFEEQGLYFAARNEYRLVLLVDPESAEAREGLDRMDREVRATRALDQAEMEIRRGALEEAGKLLEETEALTEAQTEAVKRLEGQIEDARLQGLYQEARSLEADFRYPEAVAAYERLLEVAPYYEDAIARKRTIEEFMALAEEYYAKAATAEDPDQEEDYLRRIEVIWPEYRDVSERLRALEAARGEPNGD